MGADLTAETVGYAEGPKARFSLLSSLVILSEIPFA